MSQERKEVIKNWKERWDTSYWHPDSSIYKYWMHKEKCKTCGEERHKAFCHNGCHNKKDKLEEALPLKKKVLAIYRFEFASPYKFYFVDLNSNSREEFFEFIKTHEEDYPLPDDEVVFLENNEVVDQFLVTW